ncbi:hypothetical protein ACOACO_05945 [Nocardioides sp. CPCC 205120]|uniref:hypothetical protein n=1 Tax=Nocardioides sp. CPCC 205120 TaxID=3406462 RepID=UPI003B4FFFB0
MSGTAGVALHAAATVVAVAVTVVALLGRRRLVGGGLVVAACASTVVWAAHVTWFEVVGAIPAQVLWLPSVGATCGAMYVVARASAERGWRPARPLALLLVAEPVLVTVLRLALGTDVIVTVRPAVAFGPVFALHTAYCFSLLLLTVLALARRGDDRVGAVRLQVAAIRWGAVGALVAEALRLQLTDVVAVAAVAVFVVAGLAGPRQPHVPPAPERLLDDLGAVVLAFDGAQRLVEWNRPAELLLTLGGHEPAPGAPAAELLGVGLPFADGTVVRLPVAGGTARLSGFSHARLDEGDGGGWTVVLRRSRPEPQPTGTARDERAAALRGLPAHDSETGLLTPHALVERLAADEGSDRSRRAVVAVVDVDPDDLAEEATALVRWADGHRQPIGVARWTPRRLAVVALADDGTDTDDLLRDVHAAASSTGRIAVVRGDGGPAAVLSLVTEAEQQLSGPTPEPGSTEA